MTNPRAKATYAASDGRPIEATVAHRLKLNGELDEGVDTVSPSTSLKAITPSDTEVFDPPKAIRVGGAGTVIARAMDDTEFVTFENVLAGELLCARIVAVMATGTTATNIVGFY